MLLVLLISLNTLINMSDRIDFVLQQPNTLTTQEYAYIESGLNLARVEDTTLNNSQINTVVALDKLVLKLMREYNSTKDEKYYREAVRYKIYADDLLRIIREN